VKLTSMITRRQPSLLQKLTPRRRRRDNRRLPLTIGLALVFGGALGAAGVYLLDPTSGRDRRHKARDRLSAVVRKGARRIGKQARYRGGQIVGFSRGATHLERNANGNLVDDITLVHRVESQIFRHRHTQKGQVNISAEDGVVILRGELENQDEIRELADATRKVRGVREVRNLLHLAGTTAPNKVQSQRR